MDEIWQELDIDHLGWQVLSPSIMKGDVTILAARDQQVTCGSIGDSSDRFFED